MIGVIVILKLLERWYFSIVKIQRDSLVFLYSINFQNVESIEDSRNFKKILKLLWGDEIVLLDFYNVFDIEDYL